VIFDVRENKLKFVILSGFMAKDLLFAVKGGYPMSDEKQIPRKNSSG
jgi:hypothetical protein